MTDIDELEAKLASRRSGGATKPKGKAATKPKAKAKKSEQSSERVRCSGTRSDGEPCGAWAGQGRARCYRHPESDDDDGHQAEVLEFRREVEGPESTVGGVSREKYVDWLRGIMTGELQTTIQTAKGEIKQVPFSAVERLRAGREYRQMMNWDNSGGATGALERAIEDIVSDILGV
ncbi:MAG: hypothetical protein O7F08_01030 [Deltaproteobacteria bacterium]|nr:hypothetical protein [Deltaproteobacteria bacterium]